jgi:hypothetical protein
MSVIIFQEGIFLGTQKNNNNNNKSVLPGDVIAMAASSSHQESRSFIRFVRDSEPTGYGKIGIYLLGGDCRG